MRTAASKIGLLLTALASCAAPAKANIVYLLNDPLSMDAGYGIGSITGTITTDGTIGVITAANIVSFDIIAQFSTNVYEFQSGQSGTIFSNPSGLSATATELRFDFDDSNNFAISAGQGTGFLIDWMSGCNSGEGCGLLLAQLGNGITSWSGPFGGTTQIIAQTPLPPTIALMISALLGLFSLSSGKSIRRFFL